MSIATSPIIVYNVTQGTDEWHAVRGYSASEAPIIFGVSPHMTRDELLEAHAVGKADPTFYQQRIFDRGHAVEKLLMPLVEGTTGEMFSAVTLGRDIGLLKKLTASFDGLTFDYALASECKSMNAAIRAAIAAGAADDARKLPVYFRVQMCHEAVASGAEKVIFAAGELVVGEDGTLSLGEVFMVEYTPEPEIMSRLIPEWLRFEADLLAYKPKPAVLDLASVEVPAQRLAAVTAQAVGEVVVKHNLTEYAESLENFAAVAVREIKDDATLSLAKENKKELVAGEAMLKGARSQVIAAIPAVNEAISLIDGLQDKTAKLRIATEKMIAASNADVKNSILSVGRTEIANRLALVVERTGYRPDYSIDLAKCIARLSSFDAMRAKVTAEVIRCCGELAELESLALANLAAVPADARHLFADLPQLVWRDAVAFSAIVAQRVAARQEAERRRTEDEAQRIKDAEERAAQRAAQRVRDEAEAEARRVAAETARQLAEAAKQELETPLVVPADVAPPAVSAREYTLGAVNAAVCKVVGAQSGFVVSADVLQALGGVARKEGAAELFASESLARALAGLASELLQLSERVRAGEDI